MFLKKIDNLFEIIFKNFYFSAHFILRFGLGVSFIIHGLSKFPLPPQNLMNYFNLSPFVSSFVAISELLAGSLIIFSGFLKTYIGSLLTRLAALIIVTIMIFAFYLAHKDWFINTKLFTSEQIFLFLLGFYFLIIGNKSLR